MDGSSNAAVTSGAYYLYMNNVDFIGNEAANGAALLIQNPLNKPLTYAEFKNLYLSSNIAVYSPILFSSNIQIFSILFENSNFFNNRGLLKGGVFQTWYALYGNILSFSNCNFIGNQAVSAGGVAHIANLGNDLDFINCIFINNSVINGGGGAINMYGDPNTVVVRSQSCRFINNTAPSKGGVFLIITGIYLDDDSSYYQGNTADEGGLIAINFFSILNLQNSLIFNSSAISGAGMLKMMGQSDVTLTNISIKYSNAPKGGVFVTGGLSVLRVYFCLFEGNQAINATLMYATNTAYQIVIEDSTFQLNFGMRNGFELSSCSISVNRSVFIENEINIFYAELSVMILDTVSIKNQHCKQGQFGCIMYILSKSQINLLNCQLYNITSEESQGNIISIISNLTIMNTQIQTISIALAGDLLYSDQSYIIISEVSINDFQRIPILLTKSYLELNSSTISQTSLNLYTGFGAISCQNCIFLKISTTNFENISNYNLYSGVITILGSSVVNNFMFSIENCTFLLNWGVYGGAITVNNSNVSIINSNFSKNSAKFGGGLYLFCDYTIPCVWEILNNTFEENRANVSGGAIKWESYVPRNATSNIFLRNAAFFGSNIASQPIRISPNSMDELWQFRNFQSGNTTTAISLNLLDYYGQIVKGLDGLAIAKLEYDNDMSSQNIVGLLGSQVVSFVDNSFSFTDLTLVATPNTSINLKITSALISYYYSSLLNAPIVNTDNDNDEDSLYTKETQNLNTLEYEFQMIVNMRLCLKGEIYNIHENTCDICPFGQYSLDPSETSCHECLTNSVCLGGYNISIDPGYWRSSNTSINIYPCLNTQFCLGGFDSTCFDGYTGPLCDVCVKNFYKFGGTRCDNCLDNNPLGYILFGLFYLLMIFYVTFTIKKNIDSVNTVATLNYEIPVFLKIGMDYVQIISTVSLLNIRWPQNFSSVLTTSGSAGNLNSIMFPFECVLVRLPINSDVFYLKLFMGSIFAWFNFLFSALVWLVYMKIKGKTMFYFKKEIIITIIVVGFTLQPSIVNMYFTAINCIDIEGIFYVKKQLTLKCWEGEHLNIFFYFVLPSLLLWSIILPLICFLYLKRNIKSKDHATRGSLIYITKGVRSEYYYWEFVMMAKRYCVSMVSAFLISDLILATSIILLIIMFFSLIQLYLKPYNLKVFNNLQDYSFYSSFVVFFFCLYYVVDQEENSQLICLIFLIFGILIFIVRFAKVIFKAYSEQLKVIVSKLDSFMASRKKIYLTNRGKSNQELSNDKLKEDSNSINNKIAKDFKSIPKPLSQPDIRVNLKKQNKIPLKSVKVMPKNNKKLNQMKTHEINMKLEVTHNNNE